MNFIFSIFSSNGISLYVTATIVFLSLLYHIIRSRGLPPGPVGLPYIGYWPFFGDSTIHLQMRELARQYGEVYSFTISGRLTVVLCSFNAIREAVLKKSQVFEMRCQDFSLLKYFFDGSFAFAYGEEWKVLRKFYIQNFKELGMTQFKEDRNGPIYEAIREVLKELENTGGKPLDFTEVIAKGCNKILRTTLFAGDEDITDEILSELCHSYGYTIENMTGPNLLLFGPIAKHLIHPFTKGYKAAKEHYDCMVNSIYNMIHKHKSTFDENNVRNDIFDRYFKEKYERLSRGDPTADHFTDWALMGAILQFIGDGLLTMSVFVGAFFKALLDHPEEQEKIYNELMDVVGEGRYPGMEDKSRLPYTNGFILEVVRTCEVFPFFSEAECIRETTIQGYRVPKGSLIVVNTWAAHYDPNEYEEPNKFNPYRYINKEGKKKPEAPILFGLGRRVCIAEGYAMAQAFLFLTYIVKNFHLTKSSTSDDKLLFLSGKLQVCAHPRNQR